MSFRINTNTLAMNALRNLGNTSAETSKSMTRLSTGLRISSAADDPAGLIVSESFRAQIAGIDQAVRNNQEAANYAKTAEGALDEVNKLLNDARALAVASGNGATLTDAQRQANQQQINSIISSIDRISGSTSYGQKKLLDGSAGLSATSLNNANASYVNFSGNFNGESITGSGNVTVTMTTDAEKATITGSRTFAAGANVTAGSFSINGVTFTTSASDEIDAVVAQINNASEQTGVVASWTAGAGVVLTQSQFGADFSVNLVDSTGVLLSAAGTSTDAGVDAVADVSYDVNGATAGGVNTVTFNQGSGLTLRDNYGNRIELTETGNALGAATAMAYITTGGSSTFQVGANAGDTTSLSLGNFATSNLGVGAVSGTTMNSVSLLSDSNATDALKVIDKAIEEIAEGRGRIGNFVRNTIESNVRSLGIQKENLSATESMIRDVDVAEETTRFTKLQILQQSGMSMLAQANAAPQSVLSLLR